MLFRSSLRLEKGWGVWTLDFRPDFTAAESGLDAFIDWTKDFVGKRSLTRSDMAKPDRKQLVGILTDDPEVVLPEGAHLVERVEPQPPMAMLGHVSSSYYSPNVGRSIALALVKGGLARKGQKLTAPLLDGRKIPCTVVDPVFFDPEGERLRG